MEENLYVHTVFCKCVLLGCIQGGLHYAHNIIMYRVSFKNYNLLTQLCEILIEVFYVISH